MSVHRKLLLSAALLATLYVQMSDARPKLSHFAEGNGYISYSTETGYFLQDEASTPDGSGFDYTKTNLGLINRNYTTDEGCKSKTQWQKFEKFVRNLNAQSPKNVQYKLLIMGRHGEGFHNVAESFYGTPAWDCYWSLQDGNSTTSWSDAELTTKGQNQALTANKFWADALANAGIPAPESYYVSPLHRCIDTSRLTFDGLKLPEGRPFKPLIKELLREAIGVHTCDRRHPKSWIAEKYPKYQIENGFAENDPLWKANERESDSARAVRLKKLLDDIFAHDDKTVISLTSHSGAIGSMLQVIGHRKFSLATGGIIPALVRAEVKTGQPPPTTVDPPSTPPTCTANPSVIPSSTNT